MFRRAPERRTPAVTVGERGAHMRYDQGGMVVNHAQTGLRRLAAAEIKRQSQACDYSLTNGNLL